MKRPLIIALLCCAFASVAIAGERPVQISVRPAIGFSSGYTKFVMDLRVAFDNNLIGNLKSELEYPLDVTLGGIQVAVGPAVDIKDEWGVELSYLTNVNDPGNVMKDHDWIYIPGEINAEFSYTESPAEMTSTQVMLEGYKALILRRGFSAGLIGGFRFQKFSQDLNSYTGWYLDDDGNRQPQDSNVLSLVYSVTYKLPNVGIYTRLAPVKSADLMLKAGFAAVFASDEDDHVLRNRLATADGNGQAFLGGIRLRFKPLGSLKQTGLFVQGDLDYISLSVKATGKQNWYGDDPITDEDDTGTIITGVPHNFTSRQTMFSARIGMTF